MTVWKDYLTSEGARNHEYHILYARLVRLAVGQDASIVVAHHITFEVDGADPNEIPSADSLMFSHEIMRAAFGEDLFKIMAELAVRPPGEREKFLEEQVIVQEMLREQRELTA